MALLLAFAWPISATVSSGSASEQGPPASAIAESARAYRQAHERAILSELAELVALPNLASDGAAIRRNAAWLVEAFEKRGLEARLLEASGPPAVYAELGAPEAGPTVLFYAHYDGQPVDPARWSSDPWRPLLRDRALEDGGREIPLAGTAPLPPEARLYGRSASDDKGPIVALLAALDALRAAGRAPSVHLKVFLEGEEEAGSRHLGAMLGRHAELLRSDLMLLCDGPVHQSRRPQLYFGARGVVGLEMTVYGARRTLHSGHYGNWAPNPALLLAHLLAGLRDPDGGILVAGYYDDVRPPSAAERDALAAVPDTDADLRRELGLAATEAGGARLVERILLPAINVDGLLAGGVGAAATNALPSEARAALDLRLVPDQTPERVRRLLEAHLVAQGWHVVHADPDPETRRAHPRLVKLEWKGGYPAARTPLDHPAAAALAAVVAEATGGGPLIRVPTLGGSIPMHLFQEILGVPVVGLPIVNHDNNQHAADENLRVQNLWDGIEIFAAVLARLGEAWDGAGAAPTHPSD